jgi:hypothetical protein
MTKCIARIHKNTHVIFADSDMVVDVMDEGNAIATLLVSSGRNEAGTSCGELEMDAWRRISDDWRRSLVAAATLTSTSSLTLRSIHHLFSVLYTSYTTAHHV